MIKKILLAVLLINSLYASEILANNDDSIAAKSWRNGFITAYKAMEVESKLQGLGNKPIDVKKYVIYFDANKENISNWDALMVQMFGYSSSIYKPIRTTNNWLIFGSYNNRATAYQELHMLNNKIFKNSEKYRLKIFENNKNKKFITDSAILTNEIQGLKKILKQKNKRILTQEKLKLQRKLKENQKVAIVYVDKNSNQIKNNILPLKIKKTNTKSKIINKKGFVYKIKRKNAKIYSKPIAKNKYFFKTLKIGDRVRIVSIEDKWGFTSKNHYILMSYFLKPMSKVIKKVEDNTTKHITKATIVKHIKKPIIKKKEIKKSKIKSVQSKKLIAPEEPLNGYIDTALINFDLYKIKDEPFVYTKKLYKKFVKDGIYYNNFTDVIAYSYKVSDDDGNIYYKIYKKNTFVKKSSELLFKKK